ncbi:MAG: DUF1826 domain-containing protein [Erythrobacteraceae bacterium]
MIAAETLLMDQWAQIHDRDCPLHLEPRDPPLSDATLAEMLALEPHMRRYEGEPGGVREAFADLPGDLVVDVEALARRFAQIMNVSAVRVRIERTDSNACRKVHADYTDVRLITTYAGPGTDIAPHADENDRSDCCLERVPTGWVGLFKGRTYDADHRPCFHRSPPAGDMGEKRLGLVIDTPLNPTADLR